MRTHFILFVEDQAASRDFYSHVLGFGPSLHEPGMTEFTLPGGAVLGLMPASGIRRLLGSALPDTQDACIPKAEVYLLLPSADVMHARALDAGARELSPLLPRDWGHTVAYSLDRDGHILACAEVTLNPVDNSLSHSFTP
jgi:uncharacterized protein